MKTQRLDGKAVSQRMRDQIAQEVAIIKQHGRRAPGLAVILVGQDAASEVYVANKRRACEEAGFNSKAYDLPTQTTQDALLALIDSLNHDTEIDGVLLQLPLPEHLDAHALLEAIAPQKDVDGFHPYNLGRLAQRHPAIRPCTPLGVMRLMAAYQLDPKGQHAVIIGASNIVGRPLALELLIAGATVTICHRFTQDLAHYVKSADILISATGKRDLIQPEWVKPGCIVIDIGMHRLPNGKLTGDLNLQALDGKVAWMTPVPGGVGPMTIASLLENCLQAYLSCH